jgi:predicted nuclease with TOPRIM domain
MENMGEDLAEDLLDKIHTQDEYLADGNMELARESALVRELTARHGDYEDEGDRLKRLRESYARLDAQLDAKTKQFEDSSHLRSQAR